MLRDYNDIIEKLGKPEWYDDNGVPRYCAFHPERCGVYDRFVAYVEIECQDCGRRFNVAETWDSGDDVRAVMYEKAFPTDTPKLDRGPVFPTSDDIGSFHYGDPPAHGCIGDTMNVISRRVLEFWRKDECVFEWKRDASYEITITQDWANTEA